MKVKETIERIVEADSFFISDLNLGEYGPYNLRVSSYRGKFRLEFYDEGISEDDLAEESPAFEAIVDSKGMRFRRMVDRPNHDHNDWEDLYLAVDKETGEPKGSTLCWSKHHRTQKDGFVLFYVDFGGKTVDY